MRKRIHKKWKKGDIALISWEHLYGPEMHLASTPHDSLRCLRQSSSDLEYLSAVRGEFGLRGSSAHTGLELVSSDAHSMRSHDQADRVYNFPPSALPHHFAKGF